MDGSNTDNTVKNAEINTSSNIIKIMKKNFKFLIILICSIIIIGILLVAFIFIIHKDGTADGLKDHKAELDKMTENFEYNTNT